MPGIAQNTYLEDRIAAAEPLELVCLLYGAAIETVRRARAHLAGGRIAERGRAISKGLAILAQLSGSLDHSAGNAVSRNLAELYDYMQRRLLEANIRQEAEPLAEVEGLLAPLAEAWEQVRRSGEGRQAGEAQAGEAHAVPYLPGGMLGARAEYSAQSWSF